MPQLITKCKNKLKKNPPEMSRFSPCLRPPSKKAANGVLFRFANIRKTNAPNTQPLVTSQKDDFFRMCFTLQCESGKAKWAWYFLASNILRDTYWREEKEHGCTSRVSASLWHLKPHQSWAAMWFYGTVPQTPSIIWESLTTAQCE